MKRVISVVAISVLLAGCKVDIEAETNYADIQSLEHKLITGDVYFEVSSCNDFDDSRKESKSLIRLKKAIPEIFSNAEYVECFKKQMTSYAYYKIPVGVGRFGDGAKKTDAEINIYSDGNILIGVSMEDSLIAKIKAQEKESLSKFKFGVSMKVNGDKKPVTAYIVSAYAAQGDDKLYPLPISKYTWDGVKQTTFTLSNVSIDSIIAQGYTPVMMSEDYFK